MPFISLFCIICVIVLFVPKAKVPEVSDPKFFKLPSSAADTAAGYPNGISKLLANILRKFFINDKPFITGLESLPRNPLDCNTLNS